MYLGLRRFSARADAENLDPAQVAELTAYAHEAFNPPRRVYVTLNTLILDHELSAAAETLARVEEARVDAVIVQDLGLCRLIREGFPGLRLHASTQMAIHSAAGAAQLARLGFRRVVLARELTLDEITRAAATPGLEVEVFLHGALCYAYSGLCLLSSHRRGLSGNRGCCNYLCRNTFHFPGGERPKALMSMKDLALGELLPALRQAGVAALKIEGRKKSPLYVAAVTAYYRGLLDGTLDEPARKRMEHDVKTVFSRPWTRFHAASSREPGVTDPDTVGHRGAPVGAVEAVWRGRPDWLVFTVQGQPLERFDGLQMDLPDREKPFGFSVEEIRLVGARERPSGRSVFAASPGTRVAVPLPERHPRLPAGGTVYCASSQAVKRSYRWSVPRPGAWGSRFAVEFRIGLDAAGLTATATLVSGPVSFGPVTASLPARAAPAPARDPGSVEGAARQAFGKLGGTPFVCDRVTVENPNGLFATVAELNALRRCAVSALSEALAAARSDRVERVLRGLLKPRRPAPEPVCWELAIDRPDCLDAIRGADLAAASEVILFLHRLADEEVADALARVLARVGPDRLRLGLPAVIRPGLEGVLVPRVRRLLEAGHRRWEVANLAGLTYLGGAAGLDVAAGWPLYVLNRLSLDTLAELGFRSAACSPEDGRGNLTALLASAGDALRVIVYQDTPLAVSAVCLFAGARGGCTRDPQSCHADAMMLESRRGDRLMALRQGCHTVIVNAEPLSWSHRVPELIAMGARRLRAEFIWRRYTPTEVARLWSRIRRGELLEGTHEANWQRGLEVPAAASASAAGPGGCLE